MSGKAEDDKESSVIKVWDSFKQSYCLDLAAANGFALHINTLVLSAHPRLEEVLMSGSEGGEIYLWNLKTKQLIKRFLEHGVYSLDKYTMSNPCDGRFSPNGASFVIGSQYGTISLFSLESAAQRYAATRVE